MHIRTPGIPLDEGPLLWSRTREFSMSYNGASVIIPYVEYYLNSIMNAVRAEHCPGNPRLKEDLTTLIAPHGHSGCPTLSYGHYARVYVHRSVQGRSASHPRQNRAATPASTSPSNNEVPVTAIVQP